jgi:hypothetical protein
MCFTADPNSKSRLYSTLPPPKEARRWGTLLCSALFLMGSGLSVVGCDDAEEPTASAGVSGGASSNPGGETGAGAGEETSGEGAHSGGGGALAGMSVGGAEQWLPERDQGVDAVDLAIAGMSDGFMVADAEVIPPEVTFNLTLSSPELNGQYAIGQSVEVQGHVEVIGATLDFTVLDLTLDGALSIPFTLNTETGALTATLEELSAGAHTLTLTARVHPDYVAEVTTSFEVLCDTLNRFDEALSEDLWLTLGAALWDPRQWLELTNNQVNTSGGIFYTGAQIRPGDLDIEFDFSTAKCLEPGLCDRDRIHTGGGLAVSFWAISPASMPTLWDALSGGGLGHTVWDRRLMEQNLERVESFHIEFDTYSNHCGACGTQAPYDGCGNPFYDPTHENHVAVHLNGRHAINGLPNEEGSYCDLGIPGADYADYWAAFPEMDDGEWHHMHLTIQGTQIKVWLDERLLIDFPLPNLDFKGGVLGFSAGSGVNGNYHRVDNLRVNSVCPSTP